MPCTLLLGVQGVFILLGIGLSSATQPDLRGHRGIIAALIVGRLYRAGIVHQGDVSDVRLTRRFEFRFGLVPAPAIRRPGPGSTRAG